LRRASKIFLISLLAYRPAQSQRRITPLGDLTVENRMALVIGNSNYQSVPLRNPANDARAMAAALQGLGFQVTPVFDATRRQLDEATERFASRLKSGDFAVFYYSGHGAQLNQENYLIPVDFQGASAADLRYNSFPVGQVRDRLEESGARVRVMILDACRDNPFRGVRGGTRGLAPMSSPAVGTLIAYATADNSTADDNAGEQYGLYTKHLLAALNTPGLSLKQVFEQARTNVWMQAGRKQLPAVYDQIIGDLPLTGGNPASPATPSDSTDHARVAWERAKDNPSRARLEAIIREFPDSQYARLARVELAGMPTETRNPAPAPFDANAAYARAEQLFNAKDYSGALPLLRQAADSRNTQAMHLMGWFYNNGFGVAQDYQAAAEWYRRAAEMGNALSMNNLGALYANGEGFARDYNAALQWYRRGADGGALMAMNNLGYLYENGYGVTRNIDEARSWYQKAANLGLDDARKNLARLSALPSVPPANSPPRQNRSVNGLTGTAVVEEGRPVFRVSTDDGGRSTKDISVDRFNNSSALRFPASYYTRYAIMYGQVNWCCEGNIFVTEELVVFRRDTGKVEFSSPRGDTVLKIEGGREGDTFSIYASGKRYRFGSEKANSGYVALLRRAIEDFPSAHSFVQQQIGALR
jgi:TPR repeat protein